MMAAILLAMAKRAGKVRMCKSILNQGKPVIRRGMSWWLPSLKKAIKRRMGINKL